MLTLLCWYLALGAMLAIFVVQYNEDTKWPGYTFKPRGEKQFWRRLLEVLVYTVCTTLLWPMYVVVYGKQIGLHFCKKFSLRWKKYNEFIQSFRDLGE